MTRQTSEFCEGGASSPAASDSSVPEVSVNTPPASPDLTGNSVKNNNNQGSEFKREVVSNNNMHVTTAMTTAANGPVGASADVKKSPEKILSSSYSIDVLVPEVGEQTEKKHGKGINPVAKYWKKKTAGLTRTQIAILCIFPFVEFFAATVISIQGPFYPHVARGKGATPTDYGFVFGSFEIVVFIMAPIYGAKMGVLNPHRLFNYGIFTTSITCLLFGFVHHVHGRTAFILISLIVRVIEAMGAAAFVTASFSIIAIEFPDTVATTFAMMETFYGFGMIAGPTVGGALFGVGGFTLPFAVMGTLLFICAFATYLFISRPSTAPKMDKIVTSSGFDMFKMLKIPAIALTAYGTFAAATGIGFLSNNLEHHLSQFNLTEFQIGSIFMLNGGVYALSAPIWGKLCDSTSQLKVFSLSGAIFTIMGYSLVGPLPFFPDWEPSIPVICVGLVFFGLGLGATLVSAFIQFLQDALANGHPEDVNTHGLVSGLWTSMTALGFFVGPTIGGFLDHSVGFRWGTMFILVEHFIVIGLLLLFFITIGNAPPSVVVENKEKGEKDEKDKVQSNSDSSDEKKGASESKQIITEPKVDTMNEEKMIISGSKASVKNGLENPNFVADKDS